MKDAKEAAVDYALNNPTRAEACSEWDSTQIQFETRDAFLAGVEWERKRIKALFYQTVDGQEVWDFYFPPEVDDE
jgi:hypothetical protein